MTDRQRPCGAGSGELAGLAAQTAQETPGVRASRAGFFAAAGGGRPTIDVDVTTDARFNALEVAADLQERVRRTLQQNGAAAATVNVTILAIESSPPSSPRPWR